MIHSAASLQERLQEGKNTHAIGEHRVGKLRPLAVPQLFSKAFHEALPNMFELPT